MTESKQMQFLTKYRVELMGLAMIWIVLYHSYINLSDITHPIGKIISKIISIGYAGTDIFFLLSGLGLSFSLSKDKNISAFYKKRLLRIIPTFWFVVILTQIKNMVMGNFQLVDLFYSLLGLDFILFGNLYIWFIPAILICYLFFPLYYRLSIKYGIFIVFVAGSVFSVILSLFLTITSFQHILIFTVRLPVFFLGAYIGQLLVSGKNNKLLNNNWFSIIVFVVSIFFLFLINTIFTDKQGRALGLWWYPTILMVYPLCTLLSFVINRLGSSYPKLLNLIRPFGIYSLEIFAIHRFLFSISDNLPLKKLSINYLRIPEFLVYIFGTLLVSAIMFRIQVMVIKNISSIQRYKTVQMENYISDSWRHPGE